MNRFYQFFLTCLLCMTGVAAHAADVKVTINVDDASRIGIQVNYAEQEVTTGANEFTVPQYTLVRIYAKQGALIQKVKDNTSGYDVMSRVGTEYSTYPYADVSYTVTSVSEDALYTKSFTVNVDNPTGVEAMLETSYRSVTLAQGDNTVKYDPTTETKLSIRKGYGKPLYKVTKDDADVPAQGQGFSLDVTEGMAVNVTAEWPADVKYTLKFNWDTEDAKGYIKQVQVDGVEMSLADSMEIAGGSQVSITFNDGDYTLDYFKVDGVQQYLYGQYSFYITQNTVIDVAAHKAKMLKCTLNIDDPSNVTVYNGYQYQNDVISLVAGDNAIEMSENGSKCITIVANSQCFVTSINDGTQDLTVSSYGTTVNVTDGMKITVKTGKVVREKAATVEVFGRAQADYYFNFFSENDRTYSFDFADGKNNLPFGDSDLPFNFGCAGTNQPTSAVYVNGLRAHQYYGQYKLYFDNGAAICIDLNETNKANEKTVSVTLGEGIEKSAIQKMETAIGEAYEWDTKGFTTIGEADYTVTITPAAEANILVYVDDEKVDQNEDGLFVVTLTPASQTISILDPETTAISNVGSATAAQGKIYTIAGVQVKKATKGFYIINGKKCLVK